MSESNNENHDDSIHKETLSDAFAAPTTIDLLRHGKPEGGETFRGSVDVALSPLGFTQMESAAAKLDVPDHVVSSPMLRCNKFAEQYAQKHNKSLSQSTDLREISFGDWDGQNFSDVREQYPDKFNHYWQDPVNNTPPNGEPISSFQQRVSTAFWQMVKQYRGQHVLCVCHGGVVRAVLAEVLASDDIALLRYEVPYACISQIKIYHDNGKHYPQLVFHNR